MAIKLVGFFNFSLFQARDMDDTDIYFMNAFGFAAIRQNQLEPAIWAFQRVIKFFFLNRFKFMQLFWSLHFGFKLDFNSLKMFKMVI